MAHLHMQAEAGAPTRRISGDGRTRCPRTVITTNTAGPPLHRLITRAGDESDGREGIALRDGRDGGATGVVAVLAPQQSPLLGLVSVLAPSVAGGNTDVVVTSKARPWLAEHADGDGMDLNGAPRPLKPGGGSRRTPRGGGTTWLSRRP
jgi:hypothetical protein